MCFTEHTISDASNAFANVFADAASGTRHSLSEASACGAYHTSHRVREASNLHMVD
jgi:hypothetical protein